MRLSSLQGLQLHQLRGATCGEGVRERTPSVRISGHGALWPGHRAFATVGGFKPWACSFRCSRTVCAQLIDTKNKIEWRCIRRGGHLGRESRALMPRKMTPL